MSCMDDDNMKWIKTIEGQMAIYCVTPRIINSMRDNIFIYNLDAEIEDVDKIIEYLKRLIITEWIGD